MQNWLGTVPHPYGIYSLICWPSNGLTRFFFPSCLFLSPPTPAFALSSACELSPCCCPLSWLETSSLLSLTTALKGVLEAGQRVQGDTQHTEKWSPWGVLPPTKERKSILHGDGLEFGEPKFWNWGHLVWLKVLRVSGFLPSVLHKKVMVYVDPKLSQAGQVLFLIERQKPQTNSPKTVISFQIFTHYWWLNFFLIKVTNIYWAFTMCVPGPVRSVSRAVSHLNLTER